MLGVIRVLSAANSTRTVASRRNKRDTATIRKDTTRRRKVPPRARDGVKGRLPFNEGVSGKKRRN